MVEMIGLVALLALVLSGVGVLVVRARRGSAGTEVDVLATPTMRLEPGELAILESTAVDLDTVMADAGATLYIPVDSGNQFLALARDDVQVAGRSSALPSQLAGAAVAGQAGLEAMVKAGQLSGRLVLVDEKTAAAIKAGTLVKDQAGNLLGIIRNGGKFAGNTRIKPLSGSLVKSASAGPAMLSSLAMQAQLAQVEKAISEVRDAVDAVKGYLEAAEQAEVEGRRETIATVFRTARDAGEMTQSLWDQIQGLEAPLRRDVRMADRHLSAEVGKLEHGTSGLVGSRLRWLHDSAPPVARAVAGVADARRSLVQFSMLRLWWLAVTDDPTLASRQVQMRELLDELPAHDEERARVSRALATAQDLRPHHKVLAPVKHKTVGPEVAQALEDLEQLPWRIVDVRRTAELEA